MSYAKVENGVVVQVGLPATGTLSDGRTVSCYDRLAEDILFAEGWLPLVDNRPVYDPETEYLEHAGYTVTETGVTVNYVVKLIPIPPKTEIELLREENAELRTRVISAERVSAENSETTQGLLEILIDMGVI